jgi:flagellar M-ring protein FliF
VQGITYIVSNSVEELSSDNVAVMDDAGRLLSVPVNDETGAGMTSWQLEIQRSVEDRLTDKIEAMIATVVGVGRVRAQVTADMSFDRVDRTTETYDPETQVLSSEQRSETEPGAGTTGTQTVINNAYQNSRKLEKNTSSVGKMTRLTAAIIVDEAALGAGKATGGAPITTDRLEAMVRDAIGADATRGDRVTVVAVPFGAAGVPDGIGGGIGGDATSGRPRVDISQMVERFLRPAIGLIAILALLILAIRALGLKGSPQPITDQETAEGEEGEGARALGPGQKPGLALIGGQRPAGRQGTREPESTAQVMRAWLSESQ